MHQADTMFVKYIFYIFIEKDLEENMLFIPEWDGDRVLLLIILFSLIFLQCLCSESVW